MSRKSPPSRWTEEKHARLEELWGTGDKPFAKIAEILTKEWGFEVSRNMLIGRCHRNGLSRKSFFKRYEPTPISRLPGPGECAFPEGHPDQPEFRYCKAPILSPRFPYCATHLAKCYLPPKAKNSELNIFAVAA